MARLSLEHLIKKILREREKTKVKSAKAIKSAGVKTLNTQITGQLYDVSLQMNMLR